MRGNHKATFFFLGAGIAATTALLLAPQSGDRTRRRIRRSVEDTADYLADTGRHLRDRCEDMYRQSRQSLRFRGAA